MKNISKIMMIGIVSILVLSGMNGTSACFLDSALMAGQHEVAGNFNVSHVYKTDRYITFTYNTTGTDWVINETHLAVVDDFDDIPTNGKGNPKIGKFPYKSDHDPGVTVVEYVIDLESFDEIEHEDGKYTGRLYIAAHAVVYNTVTGIEETAWADTYGQPFPTKGKGTGSWAMWFPIDLTP